MTAVEPAMQAVRTTCPYCGVGCGVIADQQPDGSVVISGDTRHPANFGRLCSKGSALAETLGLQDRLLNPEVDGVRVGWETALDQVAARIAHSLRTHGPESVALYVSGQLLTEDYYVANKLMKGFIGTANIDTNSRLCMASAVAGHKRAFGADFVPCSYTDLEQADLIVLAGSNTAWCHPVIYQRIQQARKENPSLRLVVIDPRKTATCESADLHLPLRAGTDVTLFNGLLNHLRSEDALDWAFLEAHTEGFAATITSAKADAPSIPHVARHCGLDESDVAGFYRMFVRSDRTVTLFSQGINQSSQGTDKVNAIINCHLATGRIGKPGMGPFSITGQPNAMGGREVGGMANQLAAHMDLDNAGHVARLGRFWGTQTVANRPGLKAVELFDAVYEGRIKTLWIMATNPVVSLPDADRVRRALERCETVIVSDCTRNTDTTVSADILLPALTWGEKDGTVTNSERRISRQRKFLAAPGEAKPDWWIISRVAQRLGFTEAFRYESPAGIFREHAALSGFENKGERDFDISGLAGLDGRQYDRLEPVQWPVRTGAHAGDPVLANGRFFHPNGKARLIPVTDRPPAPLPDNEFPLILNTGRVRDHWHTLTRTGKSARLSQHINEPYAQIHPVDAARYRIADRQLVRISSRRGSVVIRGKLSAEQLPGNLFVPMHWNDQYASLARINSIVNPATDQVSGQPGLKHTPVTMSPLRMAWEGFLISRHPVAGIPAEYWSAWHGNDFWHYQLAGGQTPANWPELAREHMRYRGPADWLEYHDRGAGHYRAANIHEGKLESCLFIARTPAQLPDRDWLQGLFGEPVLDNIHRSRLLAGRPADRSGGAGPVICSCHGVGRNTLVNAIREQGLIDVAQIGIRLKAGTNCGSCIPELKQLLATASGVPDAS